LVLLLFIFFAKSLYKHGYTQIYQVAKNQKNFVKFEAFIILQSHKVGVWSKKVEFKACEVIKQRSLLL
ncbi:MAG: hypothetical protein L3J11_10805, partial [Draconibacterium sp.]|nr:hypothetical protein [Draconibacterium sp.]